MRKLKNRKIIRYVVQVACGGVGYPPGTFREIHLTKRQLEKLSDLPVGGEVFLSCFYGGAGYRVLRTPDGLLYMPWMTPYRSAESTRWLQQLMTLTDDRE
jgi:hypothetical protein